MILIFSMGCASCGGLSSATANLSAEDPRVIWKLEVFTTTRTAAMKISAEKTPRGRRTPRILKAMGGFLSNSEKGEHTPHQRSLFKFHLRLTFFFTLFLRTPPRPHSGWSHSRVYFVQFHVYFFLAFPRREATSLGTSHTSLYLVRSRKFSDAMDNSLFGPSPLRSHSHPRGTHLSSISAMAMTPHDER